MIVHAISAQVAAGKSEAALEWTKDIKAYVESKGFAGPRAFQPQYGDQINRMVWVWEFDSLAAFEEWNNAVEADEGGQQRVKSMDDIFVPGSAYVMAYKEVV